MVTRQQLAEVWTEPQNTAASLSAAILPFRDMRRAGKANVPAVSRTNELLKRGLDLAIALPLFVLCAPLMLALAALIKIDSAGPVFFRQKRLGRGGAAFDILKFRTMTVLEDGENVTQVRQDDDRVTRVGRWLRRASLDELPQFLNVIAGEMSLVGPRPHAIAHDRLYGALIENYQLRQLVKPGITGWAQVNGARGETPAVEDMRRRVILDIWYARNANLALDLRILARTPGEVFSQRNAY